MTTRTPTTPVVGRLPALLLAPLLVALSITTAAQPAHAAVPIGPGKYENTSSAVSLLGPWSTITSSQDSGGSHSSLGSDGYAELTFNTSALRWITRTNTASGIADVYIDGVKKGSVDLYSATTKYQQVVYEVSGLSETDHTVRVIRTGTKNAASAGRNITLDAFDIPDIYPPSAPTGVETAAEATGARVDWTASPESDVNGYRVYRQLGTTGTRTAVNADPATATSYLDEGLQPGTSYRYQVTALDLGGNESAPSAWSSITTPISAVGQGTYENDSSRVTLSGPWTTTASTGAGTDSGGSFATLAVSGYAELSFATSGIQWMARTNSSSGIADVYVDGVKQASIDLYSASTAYRQLVWEATGLTETDHTVRIVRSGTKNDSSSGRNINLDAFVAPDLHAPSAPTGVEVIEDGTGAALSWAPNPETDVTEYRIYRRDGSAEIATRIGTTDGVTNTFDDAGLEPGTTYEYLIRSVDSSDNASDPSTAASFTMAIAAQGPGTYQNDSPAVTLSGSWTTTTSAQDSGGSYAILATSGYAELSFNTSGVRWIARTNSFAGIADVYVDGVKKASVDLYSATTKYQQQVYEISGLSETNHTIRVVRTGTRNASSGGSNLIVDAFVAPDIYPPSAPTGVMTTADANGARVAWTASPESDVIGYRVYRQLGTTGTRTAVTADPVTTTNYLDDGLQPGTSYRYQVTALDVGGNESAPSAWSSITTPISAVGQGTYENDSVKVTLSGPWTTTSSSQDSGGSFATLGSTGYAELSFKTSGIKWITRRNAYAGIADVYLDGVKVTTVDLYAAATTYQQVVWEATGLTETDHTVRIVRSGSRNVSSGGSNLMLDAFVAPDIHAPSAPTQVNAVAEGTGAKITWAASPESDVASYRVFRRTGGTGSYLLIGSTAAAVRTFTDPGLKPGTQHQYQIAALDTAGNSSAMSAVASMTTPITAHSAGTYENTSAAVTLSGPWSTTASSLDSGGSFSTLSTTGYAELSFNASGVKWIGRTNAYSGIADVYIDGIKTSSIDLYTATTKVQQVVYEISGLPEANHTIRIVRTGARSVSSAGGNVIVDAFNVPDVYPPSVPTSVVATPEGTGARIGWSASPEPDVIGYRVYRKLGLDGAVNRVTTYPVSATSYRDDGLQPGTDYHYFVVAVDSGGNESGFSNPAPVTTNIAAVGNGLYENDSPRVTLSGSWVKTNSTGANTDSGGSFGQLGAPGYAELSFNTSGVKWLSRVNAYAGIADVYLDGVKKATVDLYSPTTKYQQVVWQISGLPEVNHTIRIVRTGTKNPSSGGSNMLLDAFSAPDIYAPSAPSSVQATAQGTGASITWTKSPEADTAGYQVLRADPGATFYTLIGTTPAGINSFADIGLADATTFRFQVIARDGSDNVSPPSSVVSFTTAPSAATSPLRYANCPTATQTVSTRSELVIALAAAAPGSVIRLNPGTYTGRYTITASGTASAPIWVCGPRTAVLDGGGPALGNGVRIENASNVVLAGMTVRSTSKGITVVSSRAITIADTRVENIGEEAIHLRNNTTDSTVIANSINDTGLVTEMYGEGVYVGSSEANWCANSNCEPDRSDRNTIVLNDISQTTAEPIEAKEGATNGLITLNSIDGTGMTEHSDSLIAIQSNGWVVSRNSGVDAPLDGIQVWEYGPGWGMNNILYANHFDRVPGYAVRLPYNELGNVLGCDNTIGTPSWGVSNKSCQY